MNGASCFNLVGPKAFPHLILIHATVLILKGLGSVQSQLLKFRNF